MEDRNEVPTKAGPTWRGDTPRSLRWEMVSGPTWRGDTPEELEWEMVFCKSRCMTFWQGTGRVNRGYYS